MFKKIAFAAPMAVLALSSSMAFAATEARHSISLTAHVPSDDFYAVPVNPSLTNEDQDMSYDPAKDAMRAVEGHYFDILHTAGAVSARLETPAQLIAGSNQLESRVERQGTYDHLSGSRHRHGFQYPLSRSIQNQCTGGQARRW
jgi:hypothetical protein